MKKILILSLVLISLTAFSADMLDSVQGKWSLDTETTMAQPELKEKMKDEKQATGMKFMLGMMSMAVFEFKKDSLAITMEGDAKSDKFKVLKNNKKELVIQNANTQEKMYISKHEKGIVIRDTEPGKPTMKMPPLVLKKK